MEYKTRCMGTRMVYKTLCMGTMISGVGKEYKVQRPRYQCPVRRVWEGAPLPPSPGVWRSAVSSPIGAWGGVPEAEVYKNFKSYSKTVIIVFLCDFQCACVHVKKKQHECLQSGLLKASPA